LAPNELVAAHAAAKARDVAARTGVPDGGGVLAADTAVVVGRATVLGKPNDRDEARQMLTMLSGREHVVATAVCLITAQAEHAFVDQATMCFRPFGVDHIAWYLERGEWHGRAGAYAIQGSGASLVARVDGDFTTVVGLPIGRLLTLLEECGLAPWQDRLGRRERTAVLSISSRSSEGRHRIGSLSGAPPP
jgi:septum formation protein